MPASIRIKELPEYPNPTARIRSASASRIGAIRRVLLVSAALAATFATTSATAQSGGGDFLPTETEWAIWPQYCQARYVDIPMGQATKFGNRLSRAQVSAIKSTVRAKTYKPIHHYCFGIGYMMRAKRKSPTADALDYNFLLRSVIREGQFTFRRMDMTDPIAAEVAYLMASAHQLLGELSSGVELVEEVIAAQPELPGAYVALALLYRRDKEIDKAIHTLELAMARVTTPSAELYYTAAVSFIDKSEFITAQNYAVKAYELGYPLPGLKRKLAKHGYWPPRVAATGSE